ncbi:MAG: DUF2877 domain-containing protein, partial [Beijerinckiaceae bacterium]
MPRLRGIGPVAARILACGARNGKVIAVFDRSLHISIGGDVICLVAPALGHGPLNILVDGLDVARVRVGAHVCVDAERLCIEGLAVLQWRAAPLWQPAAVDASKLRASGALISHLCAQARRCAVPGSLLCSEDESGPVDWTRRAARKRIAVLRNWIESPTGTAPVADLVGLGNGLTPAGDDYIGGVLLAAHALGAPAIIAGIECALATLPNNATTPLSFALLKAACEGIAHESIHALLHALAIGAQARAVAEMKKIIAIGHSSGSDTLAGMALILEHMSSVAE